MKIGMIGLIVAAFGTGVGIGYATGYMTSENKFRIKIETERNKWNEQNKEKGEPQKEEKVEEKAEEDSDIIEGEIVDETDKYKETSSIYRAEEGVKEKINYDKCFGSAKEKEEAPVEHPDTPYYISEDQYNESCPEYDKIELEYYAGSQELINPLTGSAYSNDDIFKMLLDKVRSKEFAVAGELFIRDDPSGIDYWVNYIDGAYY